MALDEDAYAGWIDNALLAIAQQDAEMKLLRAEVARAAAKVEREEVLKREARIRELERENSRLREAVLILNAMTRVLLRMPAVALAVAIRRAGCGL